MMVILCQSLDIGVHQLDIGVSQLDIGITQLDIGVPPVDMEIVIHRLSTHLSTGYPQDIHRL